MVVPAARNLHWRYTVLHKAFLICKEKIAIGESMDVNLQMLIDAATSLFGRLQKGSIIVHNRAQPINVLFGEETSRFGKDEVA